MIEERANPSTSSKTLMQEHIDRYKFALNYCKDKQVLDIACGTGYGTRMISQVATSVIGVDISEDAIKYANASYKSNNIKYVLANATNIPYAANTFDVIVSFETLEHILSYKNFLSECRRVLKQDGIFICSTPNALISSPDGEIDNPYHAMEFTPDEFVSMMNKEFSMVTLYGQCNINCISYKINKHIMKIKTTLGINKRLLIKEPDMSEFPVSDFKNNYIKSAYMVVVCK